MNVVARTAPEVIIARFDRARFFRFVVGRIFFERSCLPMLEAGIIYVKVLQDRLFMLNSSVYLSNHLGSARRDSRPGAIQRTRPRPSTHRIWVSSRTAV